MNRRPNNLTIRIMQACSPFAMAGIVILAGFGCGKSPQAGAGGATPAPPSSPPSLASAVGADSDEDGIPDAAELGSSDDRDSFRRWFAYIAEMQFYKISGAWNEDQGGCGGLCRVAHGE